MNTILRTKIETCLELASGSNPEAIAKDFKRKVIKVTNISSNHFDEMGLTADSYKYLLQGFDKNKVLNQLF